MTAEHPEGWTPGPDPGLQEEDVRAALSKVDIEASSHGANYAAGMRNARSIMEQELLDRLRESQNANDSERNR